MSSLKKVSLRHPLIEGHKLMMRDSRTVKDIHGTGIDTFIPAHDSYDLLDLLGTEINAGVIDFEGNFKLKELKGLHY
jgi:hypothetical protein